MYNFKIIKKGYSQLEVDSYIERLKYDYEARLAEQKDRIFYLKDQLEKVTNTSGNKLVTSLVSAVERAQLIENSSKNIYELETKKLSLLYNKMEKLLRDENIQNDRSIKRELLSLIQDCRLSLQNNLAEQDRCFKESSSGDPVKRLLSKMIGINKMANEAPAVVSPMPVEQKSDFKVVQVKRQDTPTLPRREKSELQEFLSTNNAQNSNNFENIMFMGKKETTTLEESGFDLKEAVNPKDDLEEIMRAFDFFNDKKDD